MDAYDRAKRKLDKYINPDDTMPNLKIKTQSLRDSYAQSALTGVLSNASLTIPAEDAVYLAFRYADLCLEERKKCR